MINFIQNTKKTQNLGNNYIKNLIHLEILQLQNIKSKKSKVNKKKKSKRNPITLIKGFGLNQNKTKS